MEDILVDVLCLCSPETLEYVYCADHSDSQVLGIPLSVLQYVLHKNLPQVCMHHSIPSVNFASFLLAMNRKYLLTNQVSDSYKLRYWKSVTTAHHFVKKCKGDLLKRWLEQEEITSIDGYAKLKIAASNPEYNTNHPYTLTYACKHNCDLTSFPINNIKESCIASVAIAFKRWDLMQYVHNINRPIDARYAALLSKDYNLFMEPTKYIPNEYHNIISSQDFIPFDELNKEVKRSLFVYIAYDEPKFLRHFNLTKNEIRKLFVPLNTYMKRHHHSRHAVRYLRDNDLWNEFPYLKKIDLVCTQLHDREEINIDNTIDILLDGTPSYKIQEAVFILIEWYCVAIGRLMPIIIKLQQYKYDSIYNSYISKLI